LDCSDFGAGLLIAARKYPSEYDHGGLTQAYISKVFPDLPWVGLEWRARGTHLLEFRLLGMGYLCHFFGIHGEPVFRYHAHPTIFCNSDGARFDHIA
jgi:hypothetical protein